MKPNSSIRKVLAMAVLAAAAGMWGACSTDEPNTPSAPSAPSVPSAPTTSTWTIQISANPSSLTLPFDGSADPVPTSLVTFNVRRQSDGQPAPSGLQLRVTVTNGTLAAPFCPGTTTVYCPVVTNGIAQAVFTPTAGGVASITANADGAPTATTQITIVDPGTAPAVLLSHVEPSVVDPAGGQEVTIFGSNIVDPVRVVIDGTPARVLSSSPTSIRIIVPPAAGTIPVGTTRPVTVTVTSGVGTEFETTDSLANGLIYAHGGSVTQPQVFSVTPTTGPQEGNTRVVINGNGFQTPVQVLFIFTSGVQLEARIESAAATQLVVRTPDIRTFVDAGTLVAPVVANIRVINLENGFSANASQQFFYGSLIRLTSITPDSGTFSGGDRVVIAGNGFDEPLTVTIGGVAQEIVQVSGTQIVIRTRGINNATCGGRTTQPVVVTLAEGGASASGLSFTDVGPPIPRIFGVNPTTGSVGAAITILGDGFDSPVSVRFGGTDGSSAATGVVTSTSISATVPTPPPTFTFATEACDGNGDGIPGGGRDIPTRISITVTNLDSNCTATLSNGFTLNPLNTTCRNDTSVPPTFQCSDGVDNDGDTFIDHVSVNPAGPPNGDPDPGCTSPQDNTEAGA